MISTWGGKIRLRTLKNKDVYRFILMHFNLLKALEHVLDLEARYFR